MTSEEKNVMLGFLKSIKRYFVSSSDMTAEDIAARAHALKHEVYDVAGCEKDLDAEAVVLVQIMDAYKIPWTTEGLWTMIDGYSGYMVIPQSFDPDDIATLCDMPKSRIWNPQKKCERDTRYKVTESACKAIPLQQSEVYLQRIEDSTGKKAWHVVLVDYDRHVSLHKSYGTLQEAQDAYLRWYDDGSVDHIKASEDGTYTEAIPEE